MRLLSKKGMAIFCPSCSKANIVYQFNWKSLECPNCHGRFEKFQYLLDENLNDIANNIRKQLSHYLDYLIMTSLIDRMPNNDFETRGANLKGKSCITPKMPDAVYRSWVLDKYELFESEAILKLQQTRPHKILVRTFGQNFSANVEFYKIIGHIKDCYCYVQKLRKELICGNNILYCYFMPTDIELDDIRIVEKVGDLFVFEEFSIDFDDSIYEYLSQAHEKQFEWDGFPVLCNLLNNLPNDALLNSAMVIETEQEYELCTRPLIRLKKLEKINSI